MNERGNDFVVVANRLPVDLTTAADGSQEWTASPGGLVTALSPVLEAHQGCWVGWPGVADAAPEPHLRGVARTAVDKVMRGVVAADRLD